MSILYIILAIVLLGVLITVHEFGHFMAARLTGIAVKEFSVGFGPKLIQWKSRKHDTLFSLRPIPMGGYCMFYGDETDGDKTAKDDPRNYNNAPVWKRMISVICGPLMNMVLAFVVAVGLITDFDHAEAIIATGDADLIAIARGILYDPRWPWHAAAHLGASVSAPPQYLRSQPRRLSDLLKRGGGSANR